MARPRTVSDEAILDAARAALLEHGPGVSLSHIAGEVRLSAGALVRRFGSRDRLVFQALLPREPPDWTERLAAVTTSDEARAVTTDVLVEVLASFDRVGAALAVLRLSPHGTASVFPEGVAGPPVRLRRALAACLVEHELLTEDPGPTVDLLLGAVEARGFLGWIGPQMVEDVEDERAWVAALVERALGG